MLDDIGPWIMGDLTQRLGIDPRLGAVVIPLSIVFAAFLAGYLAERVLVWSLRRAEGTRTHLDDVVARALKGPIRGFATVAGMGLALLVMDLPDTAHAWTRGLLRVLLGVSIVVIGARIVASLVDTYGARANLEGASRRLARRVLSVAIWTLGILLILQQQGVNVGPLLTTLGIAGLAVALAFQDTLSNLFAGAYIQSDRPLDVGHYVRFEEHNIEGFVAEVGWRTTKIRTLANNLVVLPNARVANSIVTDYTLPEPRMSLLVGVPVAPGTDSARAELLILEEARKAAGSIPGFLETPEPFVRFIPGFTDRGLEFTLICQVESFVDQYAVQHELRHRISARLHAEGLAPSMTHRVVRLDAGVTK